MRTPRYKRPRSLLLLSLVLLLLLPQSGLAQADWARPYDKDSGYTYLHFGSFTIGKDGEVLPILWRVLEQQGDLVYVMSDAILAVSKLHDNAQKYPGWEQANLRAWLQEDFISQAFTEEEQRALETTQEGIASLPSSDDVKNPAFGFTNDKSRRILGSPWAMANGLFFYRSRNHSPYWLRTPSDRPHAHRSIKLEGNIGYLGVTNSDMGVLPVVWLKADLLEVASGSGSLGDPYVLKVKQP